MTQKTSGFTVIELVVAIVLLFAASGLFLWQKGDLRAAERDSQRKMTLNSLYYNLEEVFYATNQYYPEKLTRDLPGLDTTTLEDPDGIMIGEADSDLRYQPAGCRDGKCVSYQLRADLEKEADFVKKSVH